jgi:hypothetical protein
VLVENESSSWDVKEQKIRDKQDRFLRAYAELGTIRAAGKVGKTTRETVVRWSKENVLGFRDRFDGVRQDHREYLESKMFSLIEEMKPGQNPTLLIFALNGAWPEKYKNLGVMGEEAAKETLSEIRKLAKESKVPGPVSLN